VGKGSQCIGLTISPPSCADCLEILGASAFWYPGPVQAYVGFLYLCFYIHHYMISFVNGIRKWWCWW
jgi:hypothetical protein